MVKILFVCHGNICRSPMAEFVMKKLAKEQGVSDMLYIASAATSTEEIGNPVYPPVKRLLARHNISCSGKTAVQMTKSDYAKYDYLVGMDSANYRNMMKICGSDKEGKISLLMDYTDSPHSVADPWYSGDFEATWKDVNEGCAALMRHIKDKL